MFDYSAVIIASTTEELHKALQIQEQLLTKAKEMTNLKGVPGITTRIVHSGTDLRRVFLDAKDLRLVIAFLSEANLELSGMVFCCDSIRKWSFFLLPQTRRTPRSSP